MSRALPDSPQTLSSKPGHGRRLRWILLSVILLQGIAIVWSRQSHRPEPPPSQTVQSIQPDDEILHRPIAPPRRQERIPLFAAVQDGETADVCRLLAQRDAKRQVEARDIKGRTALHYAVGLPNAETSLQFATLLIAQGAKVNTADHEGKTPLMFCRSLPVTDLLIAHKADVNARDFTGHTTLMQNVSPQVSATLIAHGADVNAQDPFGNTPLLNAIRSTSPELVEALLQHGARVDSVNRQGETPLFAARATRFEPIITLITNAGATR